MPTSPPEPPAPWPPVLVLWVPGPDPVSSEFLARSARAAPPGVSVMAPALPGHHHHERITVLSCEPGAGLAATLNEAASTSGQSDLALLAGVCRPPAGWLERLAAAACSDDTIAAAGAICPPLLGGEAGHGLPPHEALAAGEPLHPRIFELGPPCVYIRRSAIQLLGAFDASLHHPVSVLGDFSARAIGGGLACALADDVQVEQPEGALAPCPEAERRIVGRRHPWVDAARATESSGEVGPLRRALIVARAARRTLSVTIDARALGATPSGTQVYVSGLVRALGASGRVSVRAVVRSAAGETVSRELEDAGAIVLREDRVNDSSVRSDIAHRPQQVFTPEDLSFLRGLGERLVVTHLDLISYRNPSYHASPEAWQRYRRTTRLALSSADQVVFFSDHARRDAIAEELIEPQWTALAGVGITPEPSDRPCRRPVRAPSDRPLLVMIGADYMHKNRVFAMRLVDALHRRHGWDGLLVLAGPHVAHGSSASAEAELHRELPDLSARVLDLGPVDEAEKRWLLRHGQAVLCPSTYEGFGLTPLEASAAGIPCVYPSTTSLADVVGPEAATIVPWDPAASSDRAIELLRAGEPRERHLRLISAARERYSWESVLDRLCETYERAIRSPFRSSVPRAWEELERERLLRETHDGYVDLRERVDHGLPLIDRGGLLTREQQRGLMRIAARRWLRAPVLGPVGLLGGLRDERRR